MGIILNIVENVLKIIKIFFEVGTYDIFVKTSYKVHLFLHFKQIKIINNSFSF